MNERYIAVVCYHYDATEPLAPRGEKGYMTADYDDVPGFATKEEAQRLADLADRHYGQSGDVWVVTPAEKIDAPGSS